MKKSLLKLTAVLSAAIVCVSFASCGSDDKDDVSDPETPITPVEPTKDNAMTPLEQKEYIEKVALEFMEMMPSSDFDDIAELGKYIGDTYVDDYDWEDVEGWAKDAFNAAREALGTSQTVIETEKWGNYTYKYNYIYTNYKALLLASNFTGHFTARNGRWAYEKANDLQFLFTDKKSQQCVLKLETGGKVKNVHLLNVDDWKDDDYSQSGSTYSYTDYYDRTQCVFGLPERIIATLTQGGSQVAKTTVKINLDNITDEEFDISKSSLTTTALIELNNGYKFDVSNISFNVKNKASVTFSMSKNGKTLVSMNASADPADIPSVNVSEFSTTNFNEHIYDFDKMDGKNAFVKLDILGKIQLQGTLSDIRKFSEYLENAAHFDHEEKAFKSYINQANMLADINLFFDNKNVKQASIKLEPFVDEKWNGTTYWEAVPVIYFFDGSSYSTFEAFFNEKDFKKTFDTFKNLTNKYASLVGEHVDW